MINIKGSDYMDRKDCIPYETPILPDSLARAYVPIQKICDYFEPMEGLKNGTIFPGLYKPFKY